MILSDDDSEIKSKIYSFNLRLVLKHILHSQDVFFLNLLFRVVVSVIPTKKYQCITNDSNCKERPYGANVNIIEHDCKFLLYDENRNAL